MELDLLDLYRQASAWTAHRAAGARDLDAPTPCDGWTVRVLLDHMLETQSYFAASARGEDAPRPGPTPVRSDGEDPAKELMDVQGEVEAAFGQDGAAENAGMLLGIAFTEQLLHGWDLARATGQDSEMPPLLAEAAFSLIHGKFTDEQRQGVFGPELPVAENAGPQQRLLAYTGRGAT